MRILHKKVADVTLFHLYFSNHSVLSVNEDLFNSNCALIFLVYAIITLIDFSESTFPYRHSMNVETLIEFENFRIIVPCFYNFVYFFNNF